MIYVFLQCSFTNMWVHNRACDPLTLLLVKTWNDVRAKSLNRKDWGDIIKNWIKRPIRWEHDIREPSVYEKSYQCIWNVGTSARTHTHTQTHMHCKLHIVIPHACRDTLYVGHIPKLVVSCVDVKNIADKHPTKREREREREREHCQCKDKIGWG